ncbi:hypothetical protein Hanom_Chr06g00507801 [Helianthus anomalus]
MFNLFDLCLDFLSCFIRLFACLLSLLLPRLCQSLLEGLFFLLWMILCFHDWENERLRR